jgi:hypothetical protein
MQIMTQQEKDSSQKVAREFNGKLTQITRVEVIDENGRTYVNWKKENKVEISIQDDGRTLKVFISQKK